MWHLGNIWLLIQPIPLNSAWPRLLQTWVNHFSTTKHPWRESDTQTNNCGQSAGRATQHWVMSATNEQFIIAELNKSKPKNFPPHYWGRSESISNKRSWCLSSLFFSPSLCSFFLWFMEPGIQLLLCVNIIMQIRKIELGVYFLFLSGLYLVTTSFAGSPQRPTLRAQTATLKATLGLESPELLRFRCHQAAQLHHENALDSEQMAVFGCKQADISQRKMHQTPS